VAAVGLALVSGAFYWVSTGGDFVVDPAAVAIDGVRYADIEAVRADLGLGSSDGAAAADDTAVSARNIFRLRTAEMERRIETMPAVLSASVVASVPNRLTVLVREREPILVWRAGEAAWLIDRLGVALAAADVAGDPTAAALPQVEDRRSTTEALTLGGRLGQLDLEVARLLGAVTPAGLGSSVTALAVSVDDTDGWAVSAPGAWKAIFGHFTPDLHKTDDIPRQVQCLSSLLADREPQVGTVLLAVSSDRCGTFTDASPAATRSPGRSPGRSPADASPEPSQ
jgi:hypothetical protein